MLLPLPQGYRYYQARKFIRTCLARRLRCIIVFKFLLATARTRVAADRNCAVDRLQRSLPRLYRPQSAMSCSTLRERAAWSSSNASQVSLFKLSFWKFITAGVVRRLRCSDCIWKPLLSRTSMVILESPVLRTRDANTHSCPLDVLPHPRSG